MKKILYDLKIPLKFKEKSYEMAARFDMLYEGEYWTMTWTWAKDENRRVKDVKVNVQIYENGQDKKLEHWKEN